MIAAGALVLLAAALAVLQGMFMKHKASIDLYLENSTPVCRIPDLDRGFIPQGLSYWPDTDSILITGYMGLGGSSPIYIVDRSSGLARKILMEKPDGKPFRGHAGGISICGGRVYIAGSTEGCMYALDLKALLSAEDGSTLRAAAKLGLADGEDKIRVSFTSVDRDVLFAGEFRKAPIFLTQPSHAVRTPDGTQKAYLFGAVPDAAGRAEPFCVYSIPDNVQGACFDDGYLYLSQTDGLFSARILCYALDELQPAGVRRVLGKEVPLYLLTESSARKITRVPPMSEEILVVDGRLYILFEAASNRYRIGRKLGLDQLWSTPVSFFR